MAKNAAQLLLELFDKWFSDGTNPPEAGNRQADEDRWLSETRLAVRYMEELELWVAREGRSSPEMRRVLKYFPKYWNWIFARSYGWSGDSSRVKNYISQAEIDALDGLASKPINDFGNLPVGSIEGICEVLPQLVEEVDKETDLSQPLRQYVKTILVHAHNVLSLADKSSTFDQQNALNALVSALSLAGLEAKDEKRKTKWNSVAFWALTVLASSFLTSAGEGMYSLMIEPTSQTIHELTSQILDSESDDVVDEEIVQDEEQPNVGSDS